MIVSKQGGVSPLALHEGGFQWEVPYSPMDTKGMWGLGKFWGSKQGSVPCGTFVQLLLY